MANKYYILKCFTKGLKEKTVSGQLPPGFLPPPLKIAPEDKCSRQLPQWKIAPRKKCSLTIAQCMITPGKSFQR